MEPPADPEVDSPGNGGRFWLLTPPPEAGYDEEGRVQYPVAAFVLVLGFVAYLSFAPVFVFFGLGRVAAVNVGLCIGFVLAGVVQRRGWMGAAIGYGAAAVVLHGWWVTLQVGWEAGFHYQILLGAMVQALLSPVGARTRLVSSLACTAAWIALLPVAQRVAPSIELLDWQRQMFNTMNVATFGLVLLAVALFHGERARRTREDRSLAQKALGRALKESTAIVDNMADGLFAVNADGELRAVNESLERLLNGAAVPEPLDALVREAMTRGETLRAEIPLPAGRVAAAVASPIGERGGAVALVRDITRDKEIDRMKTDFTAMVSHELRTPLTSVLGFAKMIRKRLSSRIFPHTDLSEPKTRKAVHQVETNLDVILEEGRRLASLIDDVLDIAKMESGRMELAHEPLSVEDLVHRAEAASSGLFVEGEVAFSIHLEEDLPTLRGDRDRLLQVLVNLVSNAAKFTDEGEVRIEARRLPDGVELRVIDTGAGIPESEREAIFDRFHQVGRESLERPKGTGLGLPISRHIVEAHGGTIHAESELGEGTTMVIALPRGSAP